MKSFQKYSTNTHLILDNIQYKKILLKIICTNLDYFVFNLFQKIIYFKKKLKFRMNFFGIFNILISKVISESKVIYNNNTMYDFKSLCNPNYGNVDINMTLEKLIVFTRNGDRSPNLEPDKAWHKRMCIVCPNHTCIMTPCKESMLTVKGYHQGHLLAQFIKNQYYPKFYEPHQKNKILNNENYSIQDLKKIIKPDHMLQKNIKPTIRGYFYNNSKSHVFLKSILETLEYSDLSLRQIKSLLCPKECRNLRDKMYSSNGILNVFENPDFDKIMSSLCNDVPMNCNKFDCDLEKMENVLIQQKLASEDNLALLREDLVAVFVDFTNMAKFILQAAKEKIDLSIVSVENHEMITLLSGLNTKNQNQVPYGSAIFIELWKNKNQKRFYSVLYNGIRLRFGLFKEIFVKEEEFYKFLQMYSSKKEKITEICNIKNHKLNEEKLLEIKEKKMRKELEDIEEKLKQKRVLKKE